MGIALIVHGGAGNIADTDIAPHQEGARNAAQIGWEILRGGGTALDAVQAAIVSMEDDPAFDAGYGSYLNCKGQVEMDASFMNGKTLDAGAVAGVQCIKNPICLARRVMESEHTFLISHGAEKFAEEMGIDLTAETKMRSPNAIAKWNECLKNPPPAPLAKYAPVHGTVGCVALDRDGNVAAGTSTGGMNFKRVGRVGDSPLIGAGVYADNLLGGASATGWGEMITRVVLSKYAVDALANRNHPQDAAKSAIEMLAQRVGGTGGIILADSKGQIGYAFNTQRMAIAFVVDGKIVAHC